MHVNARVDFSEFTLDSLRDKVRNKIKRST